MKSLESIEQESHPFKEEELKHEKKDHLLSQHSIPWTILGRELPRGEIVFFTQMLLIFTVITASIYNLTTRHEDKSLWITLLSSSLGYVLPSPSMTPSQSVKRI